MSCVLVSHWLFILVSLIWELMACSMDMRLYSFEISGLLCIICFHMKKWWIWSSIGCWLYQYIQVVYMVSLPLNIMNNCALISCLSISELLFCNFFFFFNSQILVMLAGALLEKQIVVVCSNLVTLILLLYSS